jgi:dinuclear metal center YbgI/SA1388 family protein
MRIADIIQVLEQYAPPALQEDFDNAGLLIGDALGACTGVLVTLDATEAVIEEAKARQCNLVVTYHPILFKGLKRITGQNYVERTVLKAIQSGIAIYAIHTNLDNVQGGMNTKVASVIGLHQVVPLIPKTGLLKKLFVFVPHSHRDQVREAIFEAGAGHIGKYSDCSFNAEGTGTYKAGEGANPFLGEVGQLHQEPETRIEVIFPSWLQGGVIKAMLDTHPYEEVAYDLVSLDNTHSNVGSGWIGALPQEMTEEAFLTHLKNVFHLKVIRHSPLLGKPVQKVALCGGAGSFLVGAARGAGADWLVTADCKYHEFFGAEGRMVLADIGHFESEQYTPDLLIDILREKFGTFALLRSQVRTNPVHYFI